MGKKTATTPLISRDKSFDEVLKFLGKRAPTGEIDKRIFTVGGTGLSSRVISHWDQCKLLPEGVKDKKGWRKFTLSEMVWLRVVVRLRAFGFSLTKIGKIKKQVMMFNRGNGTYPFFDFFVGQAWRFDDPHIIILADGTADIGLPLEIELAKENLPPNRKDMLLISIKSVLEELGIDAVKAKMLMPLTPQEVLLVASIKKGSKEIKATISGGEIKEIEHTVIVPDHPDMQKIDRGIEEGKDYAEVVTKYQKGVKQSAEIKKTIRF
jgi:hypothetical protein